MRRPPRAARREGERHRHADDEEKEGEDRVRVGPAVPLGMEKRRIDGRPAPRVVDEDHAGDGRAPEDVDRLEPGRRVRHAETLLRASSRIAAVRCVLAFLLAAAGAAGQGSSQELPRQRQGPYEVVLMLPPAGLYAGEEMEIEFRVERLDAGAPRPCSGRASGASSTCRACRRCLASRRSRTARGSPASTASTRSSRTAATTASASRSCRPEVQPVGDPRPTTPFTFEFPLTVYDGISSPKRESAKVRPYLLELTATPRHPVRRRAGRPRAPGAAREQPGAARGRRVRRAAREAHAPLHRVSQDLARFAHEHPEPAGPGVFRLRYRFPAPGQYRIFADVAPKDAGSQVLSTPLAVGDGRGRRSRRPLRTRAGHPASLSRLPEGGVPAGRTVTVTATLTDATGRPIRDLEPWLGAMGHLLLVHQDADTFAHAHPDDREPGVGKDGRIPFLVRLSKPGRYKGWLQFQRHGQVETARDRARRCAGRGSAP